MQTQSATNPATTIVRDITAEMADFMMGRESTTREDLLLRFTPDQVDKYTDAAAREATRHAERRFA
jgi:hypothetical protein